MPKVYPIDAKSLISSRSDSFDSPTNDLQFRENSNSPSLQMSQDAEDGPELFGTMAAVSRTRPPMNQVKIFFNAIRSLINPK
jgi:hypothetical protein